MIWEIGKDVISFLSMRTGNLRKISGSVGAKSEPGFIQVSWRGHSTFSTCSDFTECGSDCGIAYCKGSQGKINSVLKKSLNCLQEIKPHSGTYFILIH